MNFYNFAERNFSTNESEPKYVGNLTDGKRNGFGILTANGFKYEGEWLNDEEHGQGTLQYPDGCSYEGQWQSGRKSGEGTFTDA